MFGGSKLLLLLLFTQVKMTHQKSAINAKKLDIFLAIAQKVHLRRTEMTSAIVEAGMVLVQVLLLMVETVPWTKTMFKRLATKRKKS